MVIFIIRDLEAGMVKGIDWQERAKGVLKGELKRRNIGYKELAARLGKLGIEENDRNIANKLARGGFSAAFMIQVLAAVGCDTLHLDT